MPSSTLCDGCTSKFSLITKLPRSFGACEDDEAVEEEQLAPVNNPPNSPALPQAAPSDEVFELEAFRCELGNASISSEDSFELDDPFDAMCCRSKIVCFES